jgi:hypothetical protein
MLHGNNYQSVPCNFDLYRHIGEKSCPIEPLPAEFDLRVGACGAISLAHISGIDFQKSGLGCILHKNKFLRIRLCLQTWGRILFFEKELNLFNSAFFALF